MKASHVLEQYQHMPSFSGIHSDCQGIVARLKADLKKRLDDPNVSELEVAIEGGGKGMEKGPYSYNFALFFHPSFFFLLVSLLQE